MTEKALFSTEKDTKEGPEMLTLKILVKVFFIPIIPSQNARGHLDVCCKDEV
jgi:hypothetical protein